MTCEHCGSPLPAFALFCGECGRSVAAPPLVAPMVSLAGPPTLPLVEAELAAAEPEQTAEADPPSEPEPEHAAEPENAAEPEPEHAAEPEQAVGGVRPAQPPLAPLAQNAAPEPAPPPCPQCGAASEPDDRFCADCGTPLASATRIIEPIAAPSPAPPSAPPAAPSLSRPAPPPAPTEAPPPPPLDDRADESTRLVPRGTGGARFVLQFSTGESYTVLGSGLAGRNPRPEPGEYVDHLVTLVDPGRSVSKTHFEFGQEGGVFWFCDRHSGNGSVIREPGAPPRPCVPGHRYPVTRGTRIDIGEQFVVVS